VEERLQEIDRLHPAYEDHHAQKEQSQHDGRRLNQQEEEGGVEEKQGLNPVSRNHPLEEDELLKKQTRSAFPRSEYATHTSRSEVRDVEDEGSVRGSGV
jgi:hypothetical protein